MEARIRAISPFWSWLPAFRAVAETEHLPSAAGLLGVGPSALSRSIGLLERQLGRELFTRTGRSITLNDAGRELLSAVRDAMRRVDDGVVALAAEGLRGVLRVSSGGAATTALVAPALAELRRQHPQLLPHIVTRPHGDVAAELLSGRLDVAFQEYPVHRPGVVSHNLGTLRRGVYCGRAHPLYGIDSLADDALDELEFVTPPPEPSGVVPDGWPPERRRRTGMVVDQLRVGLDVCVELPLLAVLTDALARPRGEALWRLPLEIVPSTSLFAFHREVLGPDPPGAVQLLAILAERMGR